MQQPHSTDITGRYLDSGQKQAKDSPIWNMLSHMAPDPNGTSFLAKINDRLATENKLLVSGMQRLESLMENNEKQVRNQALVDIDRLCQDRDVLRDVLAQKHPGEVLTPERGIGLILQAIEDERTLRTAMEEAIEFSAGQQTTGGSPFLPEGDGVQKGWRLSGLLTSPKLNAFIMVTIGLIGILGMWMRSSVPDQINLR